MVSLTREKSLRPIKRAIHSSRLSVTVDEQVSVVCAPVRSATASLWRRYLLLSKERGLADPMLQQQVRHRHATLGTLQYRDDLDLAEFRLRTTAPDPEQSTFGCQSIGEVYACVALVSGSAGERRARTDSRSGGGDYPGRVIPDIDSDPPPSMRPSRLKLIARVCPQFKRQTPLPSTHCWPLPQHQQLRLIHSGLR